MSPVIVQYDARFQELRRDPAEKAPGVAWGVKEDAARGWRGLRVNACMTALPGSIWVEVVDG